MRTNSTPTTFKVLGMHCASCAANIRRSLKKIPGVIDCDVNYATEQATLSYDQDSVSVEAMNRQLQLLGYSIEPKATMNHSTEHGRTNSSGHNHQHDEKTIELAIQIRQLRIMGVLMITTVLIMGWELGVSLRQLPRMNDVVMNVVHHLLPVMATYAMFVVGLPYIKAIGRFLRYRVANMDTLVGIGTLAAYVYSFIVSAFEGPLASIINVEQTYYDVTIIVIGFITLGKYLEAKHKQRTGAAIEKLIQLQSKTAIVLREGKEIKTRIEDVQIQDLVVVKPGMRVPLDGVITEGDSAIDESMITGESVPVDKTVGDTVIGATLNKHGFIIVKTTKRASDTVLSQIIAMVERAQGSRAPIQNVVDRVSEIFVPIVIVAALATFLIWLTIGIPSIGISSAVSLGLLSSIGVLVIACPCALGLATPTAIIVGVGRAAEHGILVKDAESLEQLSSIDSVVFDKTGTITHGAPVVTDIRSLDPKISESRLLRLAASIERRSEHPLAAAIVHRAQTNRMSLFTVSKFRSTVGHGAEGIVEKKHVSVHKPDRQELDQQTVKLINEGKTIVSISINKKHVGLIALSDTVKPDAHRVIQQLSDLGIQTLLLTGDNAKAGSYIAKQVGIDAVIAEVLPQEKAAQIQKLQSQGKKVAMVGDGINDAPALTQAQVGVAMATGTDIAIESGDVILLHGDLQKLLSAVQIARATTRTIHQNLFWAFIYNVIGIPIAAGVLYPINGTLLNPMIAGIAMAGSSVSVVLNSLRLQKVKTI